MKNVRYLEPDDNNLGILRRQRILLMIVFIILLLGASAVFTWRYYKIKQNYKEPVVNHQFQFDKIIKQQFQDLNIKKLNLDIEKQNIKPVIYLYPKNVEKGQFLLKLRASFFEADYKIRKTVTLPSGNGFCFCLADDLSSGYQIFFVRKDKRSALKEYLQRVFYKPPRLALVISNFGYNDNQVAREFMQLSLDFTLAITPGHSKSEWADQTAIRNGKEVIVHMPMEAQNPEMQTQEQYLLKTNMATDSISLLLQQSWQTVPHAIGMDNYMGSQATSSPQLMGTVFDFLKERGFFFIDNLNNLESIGYQLAKEQNIPVGVRNIFITGNKEALESKLEKALQLAQKNGKIIAVTRANSNSLEILQKFINNDRFENVKICFVSELVS